MSYGELQEVIIGTVVDIEVYVPFYTWQYTCIRVLPEFPFSFILNLVNIVVGYPIGIVVEDRGRKILLLKIVVSIDDGLDMVFVFHNMQPCQYIRLKVFHVLVGRFVLNVKHRWQVAFL